MWRDYEEMDRISLADALAMLSEDIEGMDYHPARPMLYLEDGTWLQPQLRSADGGELAGCWQAIQYAPNQADVIARHDL
jgi:hypothetical protein